MKKFDFTVVDIGDGNKVGVIFSTHYISPLKRITEIQSICMDKAKDCDEIYFDFLLCTRNSRERYAKVRCTNGRLDLKQFTYVPLNRDHTLRKVSSKYYKENYDELDWTYVSHDNRRMIINGMIV